MNVDKAEKTSGQQDRVMGGCACGKVRYSLPEAPSSAGVCHCTTCCGISGGCGYMAFEGTGTEIEQEDSSLTAWKSSSWGERGLCNNCGTSLFWRLQSGEGTWVMNPATLDDPVEMTMDMHIYIDEKPGFYDLDDSAKRMTSDEFTQMVFSQMKLPMRIMAKSMHALSKLMPKKKSKHPYEESWLRGTCTCGATKFKLSEIAEEFNLCQCSMCRKTSGGLAGCWAKANGLTFTDDSAQQWWSDPEGVKRCFCNKCGSTLAKRNEDGFEYVAVAGLEGVSHISPKEIVNNDQSPSYVHLTLNQS